MVEVESDEEGYLPKKVWTAHDLGWKDLPIGTLLHLEMYPKETKSNIIKSLYKKKDLMELESWFEEQVAEKNLNNPLRIDNNEVIGIPSRDKPTIL